MDTLQYRGRTEDERLEAAIYYDRIKNMIERMQRTGFPLTTGDVEALQFCIDVLIVAPAAPVQEAPAPRVQQQQPPAPDQEGEPLPAVGAPRAGRRIRDV
jgi:hypothetical protein